MAPHPNIHGSTPVRIFSNHSKLDPVVLKIKNSTSNITMGLPQNEDPRVQTSTNQPHIPFSILNTDSLVKERTDLTENNGISSGFSNSDIVVLGKNGPEDTVLAVEPTKRPANAPHGPESDRKQSSKRWCLSLLFASESRFDEGYDTIPSRVLS